MFRAAMATFAAMFIAMTIVAAPAQAYDPYACDGTTGGSNFELPVDRTTNEAYLTSCTMYRGLSDAGGWSGSYVKALQTSLNKCEGGAFGAALVVDGAFGPATEAAVKGVQRKYGLRVDGVYGPKTGRAMKWKYWPTGGGTTSCRSASSHFAP